MEYISGPDFPTGGIIYGKAGIVDAYRTGKVVCIFVVNTTLKKTKNRSYHDRFHRNSISSQQSKTIERIAELVKEKLEGISELRDESDKDGMRIAIDLKRGENAEVVVNNLFQNTQLENSFSINMVC